jgi:sigma54-dependent transcription regulator
MDEVQPAFGTDEESLGESIVFGIIKFSVHIEQILMQGARSAVNVRDSEKTRRLSVLLHGPAGSGKTALAAQIVRTTIQNVSSCSGQVADVGCMLTLHRQWTADTPLSRSVRPPPHFLSIPVASS